LCSQGDSGGPLTVGEKAEKTVIGVLSVGQRCELGYHTAYTKVASYLDWINKETGIKISP
jgi:secreted trypsin-like serine protease